LRTPCSDGNHNYIIDRTSGKEVETKGQIVAYKLSTLGKIFFAGLATKLAREIAMPLKLKARPEQIQAITDAIMASKEFQVEINKPGAKIEDVIQKMKLKNVNKQSFEKITGRPWPLG
jgi:hypothetical protein